ncbi:MAG: DEAD/DEAH box helicase [Rhodobacterales bacterium 34-62-10]|nr:MAG: DEAD/DEAH box helicase [Rhodobacterales bacterium 34-62-10]
MPRSLVLCPTRELAAQVAENFDTYTKYHKLTKALLIGGVSFKEQDQLIDRGVDVLIATPGRLLDHFERGKLLLTGVQIMVVDEADRMLDMGFIPDIERIFSLTPFTRQTLFFSATMAPEIERITNTFLSAPERVEVARQASASATITQGVVMFKASRKDQEASEKRQLLRKLIDSEGEKCRNAIIFCNRKTDVDIVAKSLMKYGYDAAPIHGDLEQSQRTRTLDGFRDGTLRFLVASDVAARGLDIPNVSHVFNFDVPSHAEDYVHRIGRTGRAGKLGTTIMICTPRDDKNFADVERLLQTAIPRLPNPMEGVTAPASDDEAESERSSSSRSRSSSSRSRGSRGRSGDKTAGDKPAGEKAAQVADTAPAEEVFTEEAPAQQIKPRDARSDARSNESRTRDDRPREDRAREERPREERSRDDRSRDDRRSEGRSENRADDRRDRDRPRGGQGRDSNRDNGPKVIGMGDHLPSFIALSFDERRTS